MVCHTSTSTSSNSADTESQCGGSSDPEDDFLNAAKVPSVGALSQNSVLDTLLLALWEDCADQGLFRYDVTACPTRVVPGVYGFIAQLNEGRATKKRPTEFRVDQVGCMWISGKWRLICEALFWARFRRACHGYSPFLFPCLS